MKKNLLGWLAMATMLVGTGCSSDEVVNDYSPENAIQFGTYVGRDAQGRVADTKVATLQDANFGFGVFANYNQDQETGDKPNFMNNQKVTWTGNGNSGSWTYSPIKYWPNNSNANVCFWAYAPYNGENLNASATEPYFYIHDGIDYVATERVKSQKQAIDEKVTLNFAHVMSRVGFKVEAVIDELDSSHNPDADGKVDGNNSNNTIDEATTIVATKVTMTANLKTKGKMTWTQRSTENPEGWTLSYENETQSEPYVLTAESFNNRTYPAIEEVKGENGAPSTFKTLAGGGQVATIDPVELNNDNSYFMVIPQRVAMEIEVEYYVITRDESLATGYSVVKNTVKTQPFNFTFVRNHAYYFVLHLGLTSVKLDAEVSDWNATSDHIVNVPVNTKNN